MRQAAIPSAIPHALLHVPMPASLLLLLAVAWLACVSRVEAGQAVPVVLPETAAESWRLAAEELSQGLMTLYPKNQFPLSTKPGAASSWIQVEQVSGMKPEAFAVSHSTNDGRPLGTIRAADARGFAFGVHRLLERLGAGFYLSFEAWPAARGEFGFDAWDIESRPLSGDRIVFNWHNFLSGCSTWDEPQWTDWIRRSRAMGFNGVMVHAYGNNPMAGFEFQGVAKPVGYLSSTRIGRDWSVNHVNDVRRLPGGDVFDSPVFGSCAAVGGTDQERTAAAGRLMTAVFEQARRREMNVFFAVDIDTPTANPQELVLRLPPPARFQTGEQWLPRPDTPEGYALVEAQVASLLKAYPQINVLVPWHRVGGTPWMEFPVKAMPSDWQQEYDAFCQGHPGTEKLWHSHHLFAQAKIVRAMRQALDRLGRKDVRLAFGSWFFTFLPAADRFLAPEVMLIALDYGVLSGNSELESASGRAAVAEVAGRRPVLPVAWAHHDDGNYLGRPYTPYANFHDRLTEMGCGQSGFGIIHWTTRPLDLYFKSLINQVWADRRNQPLGITCRQMATDLIGPDQAGPLAAYLHDWITTMPMVGRETSDRFIDRPLKLSSDLEQSFLRRWALLEAVDSAKLSNAQRDRVAYFRGLERYVKDVIETQGQWDAAKAALAQNRLDDARRAILTCQPEEIIRRFAAFSRLGGISRGEQGLVESMSTRWLPHFLRMRQALGIQPARINYAATSHDLLAQARGTFTFCFDRQGNVWETQGTAETGCQVFSLSENIAVAGGGDLSEAVREICRAGITADKPIDLTIRPIMAIGNRAKPSRDMLFSPGDHRLELYFIEPEADRAGQRVFDVTVKPSSVKTEPPARRVDIFGQALGRHRVLVLSWPVPLESPDTIRVRLTPVAGQPLICAVQVQPIPTPMKK